MPGRTLPRSARSPGWLFRVMHLVSGSTWSRLVAAVLCGVVYLGWFAAFFYTVEYGAPAIARVGAVVLGWVAGLATIICSRAVCLDPEELAEDSLPFPHGLPHPRRVRFAGSVVIGWATGYLSWVIAPSSAVAFTVGVIVALAIWVWTWLAFSEMEEEA
jgi:hypothetical protein